ncbi:hypothetical protein [Aeromicrobium chenweiae]|uniref:Uncharacterized protein n=1 Tax=Aeromicrobium chenweiae TaxID=2079793 RepID=A0A2S0WLM4_9ACTN|nr:hypothetical protein [Aeromicrobium chenweiae]AWB92248.1 hypothetical protein C3E78_08560 [Aeromicrobium chenweiae]TGN31468.1 hypothetical protein E4L97_14010 [Aeromicrobium chenweiae]
MLTRIELQRSLEHQLTQLAEVRGLSVLPTAAGNEVVLLCRQEASTRTVVLRFAEDAIWINFGLSASASMVVEDEDSVSAVIDLVAAILDGNACEYVFVDDSARIRTVGWRISGITIELAARPDTTETPLEFRVPAFT